MQPTTDVDVKGSFYKGKVAHRSWPQLPEEIVRLITTHYLWDISGSNYCPQTWDTRKLWYSRMAYTCIRDTQDLEKHIMSICPEWRRAIEKHLFWNQALHVLDPNDFLIFHMTIHPKPQHNGSSNVSQGTIHLTPYQHLRNILNASCLVCRINNPLSNNGLATAKKFASTTFLGPIPVCREHNHRRGIFCGLCLRDEPTGHHQEKLSREQELLYSPGILENEDEDTWPHVEATCRRCRAEWLWRKACSSGYPNDKEAIGGSNFQSRDWETRQNVDGFLEMAEGNISDVLTLAREKFWLRTNTKYDSLGQHLLAAHRTQPRPELQEEEEEDSEEDKELMLMRGSGQVRDLALQDWARHRILDGHWLSPADVWYTNSVPGQPLFVPTIHPCPWSRELEGLDPSAEEEIHPSRATVAGEVPPSFALCEQAYIAHMKQFREIMGPALRNIVRKLVMECSVLTEKGYDDPAHIARKMTLEEVVKLLREEEGVWYDGVDWIEKKKNDEEALRRRRIDDAANAALRSVVEAKARRKEDDSDSTSSGSSNISGKSSTHGSSNATSPVLSTSTLQTTPSPPPLSDEGNGSKKEEESNERQRNDTAPRLIPVDPVRSTPRLLSKIPYVPVTIAHLPQYSLEALRNAWRDACAPLYHCCCSICERAKVADLNARAAYAALAPAVVPSQPAPQTLRTTIYPSIPVRGAQDTDASEIELKEVLDADIDGEGEEEVDYDASDYDDEDDEDEDDDGNVSYDAETQSYRYSISPETGIEPEARSLKRSSDELEDSPEDGPDELSDSPSYRRPDRRELGGTPPKRARLGERIVLHSTEGLSPTARLRKRNSEELDDDLVVETTISNKRVRVDRTSPVAGSPRSLYSSVDDESIVYSSVGDEEDKPYVPPRDGNTRLRGMRKSDMDKLIPLDDVDK